MLNLNETDTIKLGEKVAADLIITNIGQLLTMNPGGGPKGKDAQDLGIVRDAFLAAYEGKVAASGPQDLLHEIIEPAVGTRIIDGGRVVSPDLWIPHPSCFCRLEG